MVKYQRFVEVPVWIEAAKLYQRVLDMLEENAASFSVTFRNQIERAVLSIADIIAEGFEGVSSTDMVKLLAEARGAAVSVQSMIAVVIDRPKLARIKPALDEIRSSAESCGRQLSAWKACIENPGQGRRVVSERNVIPAGNGGRASFPPGGHRGATGPMNGGITR